MVSLFDQLFYSKMTLKSKGMLHMTKKKKKPKPNPNQPKNLKPPKQPNKRTPTNSKGFFFCVDGAQSVPFIFAYCSTLWMYFKILQ